MSLQLFTIGHSTREFAEFLKLLQENHINVLLDVRTIPQSRRVPWSNKKNLQTFLAKEHIRYQHMPELGGLRHPRKDSINTGWRNASFRGYADYMQTEEFKAALTALNALLKKHNHKIAIMCAEAVPWRCHRSLIADAETVLGIDVQHILASHKVNPHKLTAFAVIGTATDPKQVWYPAQQENLDLYLNN